MGGGGEAQNQTLVLNNFFDSAIKYKVQLQLKYPKAIRADFNGIHSLSFPQYKIIVLNTGNKKKFG